MVRTREDKEGEILRILGVGSGLWMWEWKYVLKEFEKLVINAYMEGYVYAGCRIIGELGMFWWFIGVNCK